MSARVAVRGRVRPLARVLAGGAIVTASLVGYNAYTAARARARLPPAPRMSERPQSTALVRPSPVALVLHLLTLGVWLLPMGLLMCTGWLSDEKSRFNRWAAGVFVDCVENCGPTFVKLGQWLSTRRDLFTSEVCGRLAMLHQNVRASFTLSEQELLDKCADLGVRLQSVDAEPIGTGCVAQVYRGTLQDGHEVAIKLRRPHVTAKVARDEALLSMVSSVTQVVWPDVRWLSLDESLAAFAAYLNDQLNFDIEAFNLRLLAHNFAQNRFVHVPRVFHSTPELLVTEFIDSPSLSDIIKDQANTPHALRVQLWDVLGKMVGKMVLVDNFIHQDLHPGNIKVKVATTPEQTDSSPSIAEPSVALDSLPLWLRASLERARHSQWLWNSYSCDFKIYLLDAGLTVQMMGEKRVVLKKVIANALLNKPFEAASAVVEVHDAMGLTAHAKERDRFVERLGRLLVGGLMWSDDWSEWYASEDEYKHSRLSDYFNRLICLFAEHRVRMDPDIWQVVTSFMLIEGSMRELNGRANVLGAVSPFVFDPVSQFQMLLSSPAAAIPTSTE